MRLEVEAPGLGAAPGGRQPARAAQPHPALRPGGRRGFAPVSGHRTGPRYTSACTPIPRWNAGSFRTTEWFATFNVRGPRGPKPVTLVLHFGAKPGGERPAVADPAGMLTPLGKDRAAVSFADLGDVHARTPALAVLIRASITEM